MSYYIQRRVRAVQNANRFCHADILKITKFGIPIHTFSMAGQIKSMGRHRALHLSQQAPPGSGMGKGAMQCQKRAWPLAQRGVMDRPFG